MTTPVIASRKLSDLALDLGYTTGLNDLLREFYLPCLARAAEYDRAVGYFRSTLFVMTGLAFSDFARRSGKVRLVCAPDLQPDDRSAIMEGYQQRDHLTEVLLGELEQMIQNPADKSVTSFLASLVALKCLTLKVAFRPGMSGIFHDKVGLFADKAHNRVSFIGSANETYSAWHPNANHEGFEVFRSWLGAPESDRVQRHAKYFHDLWSGDLPGLTVLPFPEAVEQKLLEWSNQEGVDAAAAEVRRVIQAAQSDTRGKSEIVADRRKQLQVHQLQTVESWYNSNRRGVVRFVTGAGKTLVAIEIIRRWVREQGVALLLVPSQLLAEQWRRELLVEFRPTELAVLDAGAGYGPESWKGAVADQTRDLPDLGRRLTIATMQTAASEEFLKRVRGGDHLLVVADEVHRIGSPIHRSILRLEAGGRLGLSATPERFGDPEGTREIRAFFGRDLEPVVDIRDAIAAGRLVPYDYHIHEVPLDHDEQQRWNDLTNDIRIAYARLPREHSGERQQNDRFKLLLIERARIIKTASGKVNVAADVLMNEYKEGDRWLIYCDNQDQVRTIRQTIDTAVRPTFEYHSAMAGDSAATLNAFAHNGGVLVAIRCLDEGVDLPYVNRALILASSTNPREFIQRRGRVLRTAAGKHSAAVHDVLVLPSESGSDDNGRRIVLTEIRRCRQFADSSRNSAVRFRLDSLASQFGINAEDVDEDSYEYEEGE